MSAKPVSNLFTLPKLLDHQKIILLLLLHVNIPDNRQDTTQTHTQFPRPFWGGILIATQDNLIIFSPTPFGAEFQLSVIPRNFSISAPTLSR